MYFSFCYSLVYKYKRIENEHPLEPCFVSSFSIPIFFLLSMILSLFQSPFVFIRGLPIFIFKSVLFHLYFIIDYDLVTLPIYMILHIQTHSLHSKTKQITLQQSIPLHKSHRKQMAHGRPSRTIINPRDHSYPCGQFHG